MTTQEIIDKHLRQNPPSACGQPGSFFIRLFVQEDERLKAKRVEVGLGTRDKDEARKRAAVLIHAFYATGGRFTHKTWFEKGSEKNRTFVSVAQAASAMNNLEELLSFNWGVYPQEKEEKK